MPPPLALNHSHLWRIDDGAGRAIVGTGINNQQTKKSASLAMRADGPCRLAPAAVRRSAETRGYAVQARMAGETLSETTMQGGTAKVFCAEKILRAWNRPVT
jgi:hypothetical protein